MKMIKKRISKIGPVWNELWPADTIYRAQFPNRALFPKTVFEFWHVATPFSSFIITGNEDIITPQINAAEIF